MDYSKYKFAAVVDWVEIEIQTTRPVAHGDLLDIARRFNATWAGRKHDMGNDLATHWHIRIQDPISWEWIDALAQALAREPTIGLMPFSNDPADLWRVPLLEIAFDARLKKQATITAVEARQQLAEFAAHLVYGWSVEELTNWRLVGTVGGIVKPRPYVDNHDLQGLFEEGFTLYIGNKTDLNTPKAYVKTCTQLKDRRIPIKQKQWSCRLERSNIAIVLDLTREQIQQFPFETLTDFWHFRTQKPNASKLFTLTAKHRRNIGSRTPRAFMIAGRKRTRQADPNTLANAAMNGKVRDALRALTRDMQRVADPALTVFLGKNSSKCRMSTGDSLITTEGEGAQRLTISPSVAVEQRDTIQTEINIEIGRSSVIMGNEFASLTLTHDDQQEEIDLSSLLEPMEDKNRAEHSLRSYSATENPQEEINLESILDPMTDTGHAEHSLRSRTAPVDTSSNTSMKDPSQGEFASLTATDHVRQKQTLPPGQGG
ncbi:MAG: hypothetical protein P4L87_06800 [Formivibrio sp.]|nr:hypothetical protein [Formivibrio sp.]